MLVDNIGKLKLRHSFLSKRVAKMEREREKTRDISHKAELTEMKKEKLWLKDEIYRLETENRFNYDEHQGGVESFR
tara:strand:- start:3 stop:230 length:228 start_codon:yes stop_codon:yes gene_type:complete